MVTVFGYGARGNSRCRAAGHDDTCTVGPGHGQGVVSHSATPCDGSPRGGFGCDDLQQDGERCSGCSVWDGNAERDTGSRVLGVTDSRCRVAVLRTSRNLLGLGRGSGYGGADDGQESGDLCENHLDELALESRWRRSVVTAGTRVSPTGGVERSPLYKYTMCRPRALRTSPITNREWTKLKRPALDAISVAVMAEFPLLPPRQWGLGPQCKCNIMVYTGHGGRAGACEILRWAAELGCSPFSRPWHSAWPIYPLRRGENDTQS